MPLYRLEMSWAQDGVTIDRGTMSRWLGDVGAVLNETILAAAKAYALKTTFCIATDATGVLVQPLRGDLKKKQPCRRGHFFVELFDKQHVFFEYVGEAPRTSGKSVSLPRAPCPSRVTSTVPSSVSNFLTPGRWCVRSTP